MNDRLIPPGALLGVLGGGQLGAMFAGAARRLGYRVAVWDPDADAPAHRLAEVSFPAPFTDEGAYREFSRHVAAVTLEWENIPPDLCDRLSEGCPVRPAGSVLRIIQDRIEQKQFLRTRGLPVPSFQGITAPDRLPDAVQALGYPVICKTARSGYDGKGQWTIRRSEELADVEAALRTMTPRGARWIVESKVQFEQELSVLVVCGKDGERRAYPVAENRHEAGILRRSSVPARIEPAIAARAGALAIQAVAALESAGMFCVELFHLKGGTLLINEIAPRPHNSGHYTLEACTVSQFEQQVRTLCGLPLGEVRQVSPACMVNLIGADVETATDPVACRELLAVPGATLHLYGKRTVRPGRKMGHVTFLADTIAEAEMRAGRLLQQLGGTIQ
ncbi:MAG: 5-(carboxyamino)imidazole ribonucleotide synthase [Nitrospira sp.]